eukprot:6581604-Pyramimonas_sp.AAC.1
MKENEVGRRTVEQGGKEERGILGEVERGTPPPEPRTLSTPSKGGRKEGQRSDGEDDDGKQT